MASRGTDKSGLSPAEPVKLRKTEGLRSRGFLTHGGSPEGDAPRRARGKKQHANVVTAEEASAPVQPGSLAIRPKRLPSLRDEKARTGAEKDT